MQVEVVTPFALSLSHVTQFPAVSTGKRLHLALLWSSFSKDKSGLVPWKCFHNRALAFLEEAVSSCLAQDLTIGKDKVGRAVHGNLCVPYW